MTSFLPHSGPSPYQFCFRSRRCVDTETPSLYLTFAECPPCPRHLAGLTEVQWCTKRDTCTIHPILYHFFSCHPCLLVILCFLAEEMSFSFKHRTLVFFSHTLVKLFLCRISLYSSNVTSSTMKVHVHLSFATGHTQETANGER